MRKRFLSLICLSALLASCGKEALVFSPYTDFEEPRDLMRDYEDDYLVSKKETTPVDTYFGEINNLHDLFRYNRSGNPRTCMDTKTEVNLLVVPVYFTDSDTSDHDRKTTLIQNAFFGQTNTTNYDSVVGYYNKSSYGQLKISGEVVDWFNIGISSSDWKTLSPSYMTASSIIVEKAVDYLKEQGKDLSKYDNNHDGYIDGVYAVYDHGFTDERNTNTLFWAYTYYTYRGDNDLNKVEPYVNAYSWTSVYSIAGKGNKANTNYLIHEVGHLFGLTDYYNVVTSSGHYQPTGYFDMMDYNIGDHSAFSKYLYNWTSPLVIKDNIKTELKLKPLQSSGEYLLLPSNTYNNSPFGEYLLLEYFTPEKLNKHTGTYTYRDINGNEGTFTYPDYHGLKIYHVNATLGYFVKGNNSACITTVDDPDYFEKISKYGIGVGLDYAYTNSVFDNYDGPVLYHLLESSGNNTFKDGKPATNETLFTKGDDFGITAFNDFTFDNGYKPNFTLKVKEVRNDYIALEIDTTK